MWLIYTMRPKLTFQYHQDNLIKNDFYQQLNYHIIIIMPILELQEHE
jgi:hypothetical protein